MSFFDSIFGRKSYSNDDNAQIISWAADVLKVVEKAGPTLIYSCTVQVISGNNVQIQIVDWYDASIHSCGAEYGLGKFFNLNPAGGTSGIYVSKVAPHISGSSKQFLNSLEQALNENQLMGYHRDNSLGALEKCFQD